jgi:hypothetical protein
VREWKERVREPEAEKRKRNWLFREALLELSFMSLRLINVHKAKASLSLAAAIAKLIHSLVTAFDAFYFLGSFVVTILFITQFLTHPP